MAVSPIVNSFMQPSGMQQNEQQGPQDANQIFQNQFSDMAFNALRAKFPALINNVVTLKHLASDVEKGTAFGVFVISSGNDLVYIPAVMADGSIVSCEMVYDKDADQFYPLDSHSAKEIIARSKSSDPVLLQNNPRVEDTRRLFHNMVRPPTSSNVVLAGQKDGISGLPDALKEKVFKYLECENPHLLGKVASFYDIRELALKLSPASGHQKNADEKAGQSFVRYDALTKEAAQKLSDAEKKEILKNGWLVKKAEGAPVLVITPENLQSAIEKELRLTLYTHPDTRLDSRQRAGMGMLLQAGKSGLSFEPVIACDSHIYADDGSYTYLGGSYGALISDLSFEDYDLSTFPRMTTLSGLRGRLNGEDNLDVVEVFVPGKAGTWRRLPVNIYGKSSDINITDDCVSWQHGAVRISPAISAGYITVGDNSFITPEKTLFLVTNRNQSHLSPISSWESLAKILGIFGKEIACSDNGAGIDLSSGEKTASFASSIEAAEWLHNKFGMDSAQITAILGNPRTLMFEKSAFLDPTPDMLPQEDEYSTQAPQMDAPPMSSEFQQAPDFSALEDFAAMEDPDMFDTGILASFAQYPDAKTLLVEYMPDFLAAEDKIGRVLLLFSSQKKEIEEFYGSEKCSTLIASLRRIFAILGELVASLKLYINMV